ncbi:hypothetical protein DM02DRAFT_90903 [Periconia macrospinosa]|uniref:Uncharacterized protein n=1 Tax=Periconia macrospinosa TaxID=97972 RepID=A0A2V1DJ76_9PLEO|nr:hypothetical protein DM02DRAFT_90903 [Periconia macrospinosa]
MHNKSFQRGKHLDHSSSAMLTEIVILRNRCPVWSAWPNSARLQDSSPELGAQRKKNLSSAARRVLGHYSKRSQDSKNKRGHPLGDLSSTRLRVSQSVHHLLMDSTIHPFTPLHLACLLHAYILHVQYILHVHVLTYLYVSRKH